MDFKKCCELLKPLYGENNDYGLFREDLTDAEKSNLKRNLGGGACFHWKGVIPGNGYDFYTSNETAFKSLIKLEDKNGKSAMIKPWEQLTKDQKQRIVDHCNQLYQTGSSEETYVADQIMMTINPIYEQSFANEEPQLDQEVKGSGAAAGAIGGALTGAIGGAKCGIPGGPGGILVAGIAGAGIGAYAGFKLQNGGNFTYADKRGPTLLQQVQDELDGKTLQNQAEDTNTQSNQLETEQISQQEQEEENREENTQNQEEAREKAKNQKKKEKQKEENSTETENISLTDINLSPQNNDQKIIVKGNKKQPATTSTNLQDLNKDLNAIRQKITEETNKSTDTPSAVNSSTENDKAFQAATAAQEKGSWWSRNWDIIAIIIGALGMLGLGGWLLHRQSKKTKKAKAEAAALSSQVTDLNSQISTLKESLKSNQSSTNTGTNTNTETNTNTGTNTSTDTNTDTNTNTDTSTDTNTNTDDTNTGNGSTLESSGSSVPNDSSTVEKGRPIKIVIKGKTSTELE